MAQCEPFRCNFRRYIAERFKALFNLDSSDNFYLFEGRVTPWDRAPTVPGADDLNPPENVDSVLSEIQAWQQAIGFKRIDFNDVFLVVPRIDWEPGRVFDQYEDDVDLFNENTPKKFYVLVDGKDVYKCLGNNFGGVSTEKPTGSSTEAFVRPNDLYRWKFLFRVPEDLRDFLTEDFIPVEFIVSTGLLPDERQLQFNVQEAAIDGSIDFIDLLSPGDIDPSAYPFSVPPNAVHFVQRSEFTVVNTGAIVSFPGVNQVKLAGTASLVDGAYNNMVLRILTGPAAGQDRVILSYNGSTVPTQTAFIASAYSPAPVALDTYEVKSREMKGSTVLSQVNNIFNGYVVAIVSGPGIGQQREVVAYEGLTRIFTLDQPWDADLVANLNPALSSFYQITPKVTITGDGSGAEASSSVNNDGVLSAIHVVNRGSNYTRATVTLSPVFPLGSPVPASAKAIISPQGGHGSNPVRELCAHKALIVTRIKQDELGQFAVANDFRQFGIVRNPVLNDGSERLAGNEIDPQLRIEVAWDGFNALVNASFTVGYFLFGSQSGAVGTIVDWDPDISGESGVLVVKNPTTDEFVLPDPPAFPAGEFLHQVDPTFTFLTQDIATVVSVAQIPKDVPESYKQTYTVSLMSDGSIVNQLDDDSFTLDRLARGQDSGVEGIIVEWRPAVDGLTGELELVDVVGDFEVGEQINEFDPVAETTINNIGEVTAITKPELVHRSGELLYIQNIKPIQRDIEQAEEFKILVEF